MTANDGREKLRRIDNEKQLQWFVAPRANLEHQRIPCDVAVTPTEGVLSILSDFFWMKVAFLAQTSFIK